VSGVVTVRPFDLRDLDAAGRFSDAARALDAFVEPFGQRLGVIATGSRAALDLWRVAAGEDQGLYGIAFSALRESAPGPVYDFYVAVHPSMRRQGLGRALSEPALSAKGRLRVRVRDDAFAGRAFATALGFIETGAQLSLQWAGGKVELVPMPALRIRAATRRDEQALRKMSSDAWLEAPEPYLSRPDDIVQLFAEEGRLVLLAESEGKPMGYLCAVQLGRTLGIEEVAVLPQFRRMGVGRALLGRALTKAQGAVLSVSEANRPARALYRSLGFRQIARRLVLERQSRPPKAA
jgi:ribosomal protein S18 acetylase RimI-like enzyme